MSSIYAVILAAGKGTRMKSELQKNLHPIGGRPMAEHLVITLQEAGITHNYFVIGHGAESVQSYFGDRVQYCLQGEQLGTGHAVMQAEAYLGDKDGITLLINGDTPLISSGTIKNMIATHQNTNSCLTLLTTRLNQPFGYGRIIFSDDGTIARIVEEKDATPAEKAIQEVNVGLYCVDNRKLFAALKRVNNNNQQGEYYLTDIINILKADGEKVTAYQTADVEETVSINDRVALAEAEEVLRKRINQAHMRNGVTIQDPKSTYIEVGVEIAADVTILAGTHLRGQTIIGKGSVIGPDAELTNVRLGEHVTVTRSVIMNSSVDDHSTVGPFAYIRPDSVIGKKVKIGDFVEVKKSTIADGSKVSHLSYIGDAEIGRNVNIGCGSITVNYDGFQKYKTIVKDEAFIGSNVNLIAPIEVGREAFVAAGSTVNRDVPDGAFAIARERQVNKEEFALKMKAKRKTQNP